VPGTDDLGVRDALLALDLRAEVPQQVVGDADGTGLDAFAGVVDAPRLGLLQRALVAV